MIRKSMLVCLVLSIVACAPAASRGVLPPAQESGVNWIRPMDGMQMVYVPAGDFSMGMPAKDVLVDCLAFYHTCPPELLMAAEPVHTVFLDAYWIDRFEVTNAMYAKCVRAGVCNPPVQTASYKHETYFGSSRYADYPVMYITWNDARVYCDWTGARLPTEAEWEKAARGTDGRIFPWGDESPTCDVANLWYHTGYCVGDTRPVDDYLSGASPYGALNMAGNVWEWVADWYAADYYIDSPHENPQGPESGEYRVLRGGSWYDGANFLPAAYRNKVVSHLRGFNIGFRCARSAAAP